jgi:hypothetical protein
VLFNKIILWLVSPNKLLLISDAKKMLLYALQTFLYFSIVRISCLILSIYVLVLSAKPCCSDNDCQSEVGSKKEQADKSPAKEKECPGCSPFFTCGSCVGFIVSKPITINSPLIPDNRTEYYAVYQQPNIEKVALAIWLPPKIS